MQYVNSFVDITPTSLDWIMKAMKQHKCDTNLNGMFLKQNYHN